MDEQKDKSFFEKNIEKIINKQLGTSPIDKSLENKKKNLFVVNLVLIGISIILFVLSLYLFIFELIDGTTNFIYLLLVLLTAAIYGFFEIFYKELRKIKVKEDEHNEEV